MPRPTRPRQRPALAFLPRRAAATAALLFCCVLAAPPARGDYDQAVYLYHVGRLTQALAAFAAERSSRPDAELVRLYHAWTLVRLGQEAEACREMETLVSAPVHPLVARAGHMMLARLYGDVALPALFSATRARAHAAAANEIQPLPAALALTDAFLRAEVVACPGVVLTVEDNAVDRATALRTARLAARAARDLERILARPLPETLRIHLSADRARHGAVLGVVFLAPSACTRRNVRHELVHVAMGDSYRMTWKPLDEFLVEGFATYVRETWRKAPKAPWTDRDAQTRLLLETGGFVDPATAAADRFEGGESVLYAEAASFVGHLIRQYGLDGFFAAYGAVDDPWERVFGRPLAELVEEWKASLLAEPSLLRRPAYRIGLLAHQARTGQTAAARQGLLRTKNRMPRDEVHWIRAWTYGIEGDYAAQAGELVRAVRAARDRGRRDPDALWHLYLAQGLCDLHRGRPARASERLEDLDRARTAPAREAARQLEVYLAYHRGDFAAGDRLAEALLRETGDITVYGLQLRIGYERGLALWRHERREEARTQWRKVVELETPPRYRVHECRTMAARRLAEAGGPPVD